jgi:hypothetical protein
MESSRAAFLLSKKETMQKVSITVLNPHGPSPPNIFPFPTDILSPSISGVN